MTFPQLKFGWEYGYARGCENPSKDSCGDCAVVIKLTS